MLCLTIRHWPKDSILSSTFDLKVERSRASMAKRLIFSLDFSLDFSSTHISATYISQKYLQSQKFARSMRRCCACFHLTSSTRWPNESILTQQQFFCSILLTKIKLHSTSLDSHSTHSTRWPNGLSFPSTFC